MMNHSQTSVMKKAILFSFAILTAVFSNAQVKTVMCSEDDYKQALQSQVLCSCTDFTPDDLSQTESRQIDSVLHQHYFVAEGFNETDFDLEWARKPYKHAQAAYIVEFRVINKGLKAPVDTKTAFIDSLFRPLGAIDGGLMVADCCIRQIATQRIDHLGIPPGLYLYRWESSKPIPELIDQWDPIIDLQMDLHILEYCYSNIGELFMKCEELHAGRSSMVYVRVSVE